MRHTKDMTIGNPIQLIMAFSLPVIAGNLLQQVYSIVDSLIVGQQDGVAALSAITSSGWLDWALASIAIGLAQGFSIEIAHRFGAADHEGLKRAAGQSVLLAVMAVAALELFAQSTLTLFLRLLQTPEETYRLTLLYLRVIFSGLPLVMAGNLCASFLRAVGDSRTPMIAITAATVVNILLDALFVIVFRWGVAGAAAATVTAQGANALICLLTLSRLPLFRLDQTCLRLQPVLCRKLFRLGMPVATGNLVISIGGLVLQRAVNGYGFLFMAGYNAASRFQGLMENAGASLGAGVATFVGQNVGAGKMDRVRNGVKKSAVIGIGLAAGVAAVMLIFGNQMLSLFIHDDPAIAGQVLTNGSRFLRVMSLGLPFLYLLFVYRSALQGLGDAFIPMLSGVVELIMRVGSVLLLPLILGEWGIYLAEIMAWVGAMALLIWGYCVRLRQITAPDGKKQGTA